MARSTAPRPARTVVAMTILTDDVRRAVTAGRLAHLATIDPDGGPQLSAVWVGLDGDDLVIGHLGEGRKVRNIARDPRVAITVEASGTNPVGMTNYLVVHGTARLVEGGAPELLQRLAEVYLGPGVKFPPMDDPPAGHVIHVTPERIGGVGPWTDTSAH
jgi:PPOX class probable F420-dependent enzyme